MNRKTLVLPAVVGLLAPVLVACGGTDGGSGGGDAIVVGTTDQFIATADAPAPLDPAYAYDTGAWNVLRQTVQTLMHAAARRRRAGARSGRVLQLHGQGQRELPLQAAQRAEVRRRQRRSPPRT